MFSELPIDGYLSREHVDRCDQSRSMIFKRARDREFGIPLQEVLVDYLTPQSSLLPKLPSSL